MKKLTVVSMPSCFSILVVVSLFLIFGCGGGGGGSSTSSSSGGVAGPIHQASYTGVSPDGYYETGTITYSETTGSLTLSGNVQNCGSQNLCYLGPYSEEFEVYDPRDITDQEFADMMAMIENDLEASFPGTNFTYEILL